MEGRGLEHEGMGEADSEGSPERRGEGGGAVDGGESGRAEGCCVEGGSGEAQGRWSGVIDQRRSNVSTPRPHSPHTTPYGLQTPQMSPATHFMALLCAPLPHAPNPDTDRRFTFQTFFFFGLLALVPTSNFAENK